ncbi:MAG: PHB depolymerase family esterase [Gammaproteobacteria bacterium]
MTRHPFLLLGLLTGLVACSEPQSIEAPSIRFNLDASRITVSGISAGAYMAGQYHLAHSSSVSGVGLIAGGPYWCAAGSMSQALGPCMQGGDMAIPTLADYATALAGIGEIDELQHLSGDRVWVFHGADDSVIHPDVTAAAVDFYNRVHDNIDTTLVSDVAAAHGMPSIVGDQSCTDVASPFLNNCDYDAAGEMLKAITTISEDRAEIQDGEIIAIAQAGASDAAMLDEALLFVPAACANGEACGLHIAFHGCQQSTEFVGDAFAAGAGYNEWASTNRLLVLYPQVAKSSMAPLNPLGCWDWWGYTDKQYATRQGLQITVIKELVDSLSGALN